MSSAGIGRIASSSLGFAIRFVAGFAVLAGAFEASRGTAVERFLVEDVILAPTEHLINMVTPGDHVELVGRTLVSPGARLRVTRGCEGVEMLLMLVAAVLSFPVNWAQRTRGLALGTVLAYGLSVARLMALYYTLRYAPDAWESLHGLVLPLAPIIVIALYFLRWSGAGSKEISASRAA